MVAVIVYQLNAREHSQRMILLIIDPILATLILFKSDSRLSNNAYKNTFSLYNLI